MVNCTFPECVDTIAVHMSYLVGLQQIFGIRLLRVYPDTKVTIRIFVYW